MRNSLVIFIALVLAFSSSAQEIVERDFSIGKTIEFESEILGEKRVVNVYLPAYYSEDSVKNYPVIYLLDGSRDEDFIHVSGLVQFASFSWINIIPESIVVGISNIDRKHDFTYPSRDPRDIKEFPTTGGSEKFIEFIKNELQPLIDSKYRVTEEKTLIGQSLGGLLVTEILFKHADMFDNYIIASPSLWWDKEQLLDYELNQSLKGKKIYVAVGQEGKLMKRGAKLLFKKLKKFSKDTEKLEFGFLKEQNHGDVLHLAVYDAFEKLFSNHTEKK